MASTLDHTSVRYHLSYPRQAAVFTWPECACLARCLGYRDASIELCYRQAVEPRHQTDGFLLTQLDAFLGSKFFKSGFDFSYNSHSCEWNEQVVRRAFAVLAGRGMTFQELHTTRVAYGLYESGDLRGLKAKPRTVLRALKACGRAISLGKMAHRVRHMRFHEPGRLQLDEFIDLALWARPLDQEEARSALDLQATSPCRQQQLGGNSELRQPPLHRLVNFDDLLTPLDGRIQRRLDAEYRREERQYVRELVRPEESRLRACSVLGYREARLARSRDFRAAYEPLRRAIRDSRAGTATGRSSARPSTGDLGRWSDWTTDDEAEEAGKDEKEVQRIKKSRPTTAASVSASSRRSPIPLITSFDLERTELLRDALAFQTDALPEFHARWTAENMQTLRPGFHRRHARRSADLAAAAADAARKSVEEVQRSAAEAAEARRARAEERRTRRQCRSAELAARRPPTPLPSHARVCDAHRLEHQEEQRRQQRRPSPLRAASGTAAVPAATSVDAAGGDASTSDELWFEPRLGLALPLAPPTSTSRGAASRLGYARSCPPGIHPVATVAGSEAAGADRGDQWEISELIQRAVYSGQA